MAVKTFTQLDGGMNTAVNHFLMTSSEFDILKNTDLNIIGRIRKALGFSIVGNDIGETAILGIVDFRKKDGTKTQILGFNTALYSLVDATWTAYTGSGAGLTANKKLCFEIFLNTLFALNGVDANRTMIADGTWSTSTYLTGAPLGAFIKQWHERLFTAALASSRVNMSDNPVGGKLTWGWQAGTDGANAAATVFTSATATFKAKNLKPGDILRITSGPNIGDWPIRSVDSDTQVTIAGTFPDTSETSQAYEAGSNWFMVGEDDGDVITGFGTNSDRLLIFKNYSMWRWDGSAVMKIADSGLVNQRAIINKDEWTFFGNLDGIFYYDGTRPKLVSRKMQKFFDGADKTTIADWVMWIDGDVVNFYIGSTTVDGVVYANCVVRYYISQNTCDFRDIGIAAKCAGEMIISGAKRTYIGDSVGRVFKTEEGNTQYGSPLDMVVKTRNEDFGAPDVFKNLEEVIIYCNYADGLGVFVVADDGDPVYLGQCQKTTTVLKSPPGVGGRRFSLLFSHSDTRSRPVIEGYTYRFNNSGEF